MMEAADGVPARPTARRYDAGARLPLFCVASAMDKGVGALLAAYGDITPDVEKDLTDVTDPAEVVDRVVG